MATTSAHSFFTWFRAFSYPYLVPSEDHPVSTYADKRKLRDDKAVVVATDTTAVQAAQATLDADSAELAAFTTEYATSVFGAKGHTVVYVTDTGVTIDISDGISVTTTEIANSTDPIPEVVPPEPVPTP